MRTQYRCLGVSDRLRTPIHILLLTLLGLMLVAASQLTSLRPVLGLVVALVILPTLCSALLEDRLSLRSLVLGSMLAVVVTIVIGVSGSAFAVTDRPDVASVGLGVAVLVVGLAAAWARRSGWRAPAPKLSLRKVRALDLAVLAAGALVLATAIAVGLATPDQTTPYVSLSVTAIDGSALDAVIEGQPGSSTPVRVGIENASPQRIAGTLTVTHTDGVDAQHLEVAAGAEQSISVEIPVTLGLSTVRVELHVGSPRFTRLVVLRVRGTSSP